jgi:hypothetical protein
MDKFCSPFCENLSDENECAFFQQANTTAHTANLIVYCGMFFRPSNAMWLLFVEMFKKQRSQNTRTEDDLKEIMWCPASEERKSF